MNHMNTLDSAGYGVSQQQRHRVLRNTYWLLALSMLPTVLGAWIGVSTGITRSLTGGMGLAGDIANTGRHGLSHWWII